jgi:hypothetical protein
VALGSLIVAAAALDMIIGAAILHLFFKLKDRRKRITTLAAEGAMFFCEASIFVCSVLVARYHMTADDEENSRSNRGAHTSGLKLFGATEAQMYAGLCGVAALCALVTTLLSLTVPTHWWSALERDGLVKTACTVVQRLTVSRSLAQVVPCTCAVSGEIRIRQVTVQAFQNLREPSDPVGLHSPADPSMASASSIRKIRRSRSEGSIVLNSIPTRPSSNGYGH